MNQLTIKLEVKEKPFLLNSELVVRVNEVIKSNNNILIYSHISGIIINTGIMVLPMGYCDEIILRLKNISNGNIMLYDGDIIANYLEIIDEKNAGKKGHGVREGTEPDSKKARNK